MRDAETARGRWWWLRMLAASAALAAFMLSLAGASWTLAVRRCENEMVWSEWAEWDAAAGRPNHYRDSHYGPYSRAGSPPLPDELQSPLTDWDADDGGDAVPASAPRRFLRSIWRKVTGDG